MTIWNYISIDLVYGTNVPQEYLQHVVDALEPYTRIRDLSTHDPLLLSFAKPPNEYRNGGCENYGSNRTNVEVLIRAAYHVSVV